MTNEEALSYCVERKVFDSSLTYNKERLALFLKKMDEDNYNGPFKKSMFLQHSNLIKRCRELGVTLKKSQRDRCYYIMKPPTPKTVHFDPSFIDVVEEEK